MKKLVLIGFVLIGFSASIVAQEELPKKSKYSGALKLYPGNFIWSEFMLGGEVALSRKHTVLVNFGTTIADKSTFYNAEDLLGFRGESQFRIYVTGKNILDGFYVAPYANFRMLNGTRTEWVYDPIYPYYGGEEVKKSVSATTFGGGILVGYQAVLSNTFTIDAYFGGGLKKSYDNIPDDYYYGGFGGNGNSFSGFRTTGAAANVGLSLGLTL